MRSLVLTPSFMRVCVVVLLGLICSGSLGAQAWPEAPIGTRVRVQLPDSQVRFSAGRGRQAISGTLTAVTNDTLHIQLAPGSVTIPVARGAILDLAVSEGVSRGKSAVRRGIEGAATFAAVGLMIESARNSDGSQMLKTSLVGGGLGLVGGVAVGFHRPTENWRWLGRR